MGEVREDGIGIRAAKILYPLFVGQFFGVILTALTFIIVARLLGPSSYGVYTFAFGFAALVNGFLAFGVGAYFSSALSKLAYRKDGEGILRTLSCGYIISGAVSILLTLFGIGISGYVSGFFPNIGISPLILMIVSGTIISSVMNSLAVSALIGFSRTGLASIMNVLVDILQLSLSIVLTIKFGVIGAVAAMLIGYVFGAVLGLYFVYVALSKYCKFRLYLPTKSELREVFSFVWPIAATNFLNTGMQNFSILFLGLYITTTALGNYGAASKGLALISMIYGSFGSGLFPIFSTARAMASNEEINSTYNMIIHFALLPMLPLIIYVGIMSMPGLYLLVGSKYTTAPFFLTLITLGTTIGLFGSYISNLMISGGYTKSVMKINFISAVFQLIFMIALVPLTQVIGAIFTIFFLGNTIEAILFARDAKKMFNIDFEFKKLALLYLGNIVFGLILAGILILSNNLLGFRLPTANYLFELAIGFVVALIIYPPILIVLKAINEKDIISMRHAAVGLGRMNIIFGPFMDYSHYLHRTIRM